jgi:hypothetical protein
LDIAALSVEATRRRQAALTLIPAFDFLHSIAVLAMLRTSSAPLERPGGSGPLCGDLVSPNYNQVASTLE